MYDVLGCLFLDWYLMLDFDVFFLLVLDSNMFMYNIVTCWDKKKHVLKAKNAHFWAWQWLPHD
jgi:hypothetical protein